MKSRKANLITENMGTIILVMIVLAIILAILYFGVKPRLEGNPLSFLPGA